mgnify:CR=1 FL=1
MRLLIIGSLDSHIGQASKIAKDRGAEVSHAPDVDSAMNLLRSGKGADLLMIDIRLDIKKIHDALQTEHIHVPIVGFGFNSDTELAVKAIKNGAKEYIPLPPDEILIAALLESVSQNMSSIIHSSEKMRQIVKMADQIAPSDASVLITGESGTGKEVMARYIHSKSKRSRGPFISLNCAAIPDNLLESELFGHEKGAFTGAVARRVGKFEEANQGTLLLDEISEMDARLQAKLLRAIQEREIDRVGGSKPVKVDIRILATSNRNMQEEVKAGNFREDLFYRLNIINIELPSLRERKDDIPLFAEHFIEKYSKANGIKAKPLSSDALALIQKYSWPGNVRELENAMHRAVLLSTESKIEKSAIMITPTNSEQSGSATTDSSSSNVSLVGRTVNSVEKDLIMGTLEHCLGNRTHAANMLGISIRTLRNKLKQYEDEMNGTTSSQGI